MKKALQTFDCFRMDIAEILGDNLFEIIIHGSYVLHDFHPGLGDLDYMVVTNENLDDATNSRLFELHDRYRSEKNLLLHQLEGSLYPKHFLHELSLPFVGCYIGTGRKGWRTISDFQNSFMDLRMINEHGINLLGKSPKIYNPADSEILKEQVSDLEAFITSTKTVKNAGTGMWMAIAHWCSRTIFYHANGRIASKSEACRWCAGRSELEAFREVFVYAENRRYPCNETVVADVTKTACTMLLQYVATLLCLAGEQVNSDTRGLYNTANIQRTPKHCTPI